jgi:uncharacterized RDD family membrane protein YckC
METNYKIIGGDGREYGPVTLDELKGWVRDGRIGRQTQIWRSDLNSWLPASQYQELQSEIAVLKSSASGVEGDFESVGFWPRFGAMLIDGFLINIPFYILVFPLAKLAGFSLPTDVSISTINPAQFLQLIEQFRPFFKFASYLMLAMTALYEIGLTGKTGATIGKMIFGVRIVRSDGSPLGYKFALFRFLLKMLSGLPCYIGYVVSAFMVAFREDKRALHDLIVGTRVIYKR